MARADFDGKRYLLDCRSFIEQSLDHYLRSNHRVTSLLHQAMCYSVLDGGKRFRPILTLAVGKLFGAKRRVLLPFACAIELIHCYSLIHDDLPALDNDDLRRGKLSCHKRFGEAIALLAGDALLTEAFFIMSDPRVARLLGVPLISKLVREVSDAAGIRGMIGGQSTEIELVKHKVTPAVLESLDRLKVWTRCGDIFNKKAVAKFVHSAEPDFRKATFHPRGGLSLLIGDVRKSKYI